MSVNVESIFEAIKTVIAVSSVVAAAAPPAYEKKGWFQFVRKIIDGLAFNFGNAKNVEVNSEGN